MDDRDYSHPVERLVRYRFNDPGLVEQALRHASMTDSRVKSNERLEFLGDAVLGLVVCQRVYELFPNLLEGEMTKIKSSVVSRETCADIGKLLGLEEHLVLGKGMKGQAVLPKSLAAAAVEALVAAIYIDGGIECARAFLLPLLEPRIVRAAASGHQENYKSLLQQYAQQRLGQTPAYTIVSQRGPDHAKAFEVKVTLNGREYEACWGSTKKAAEQAAALTAMIALGLAQTEAGVVRLSQSITAELGMSGDGAEQPLSESA